ncbi:MAG: hypothetical protein ACYDCK_03175 [Thermoplasmatota archaeon]
MRALALLTVLVLLAGCLGGAHPDPSPTAGPDAAAPLAKSAHAASASPADAAGNATDGAANATRWVRGAWVNGTVITLLSADGTTVDIGSPDTLGCIECSDAFFPLAKGVIVPPGTASVEATATFTPPATAPDTVLHLVYRTASDAPPVMVAMRSGAPLVVPVKAADTDAPLQTLSNWWFDVFADTGSASVDPGMDVKLVLIAKRAATLPEFPPAPDPWLGKTTRVWTAGETHTETLMEHTPVSSGCATCSNLWESKKGSLVPPGATKVTARIAWTWPGPTKPDLNYWSPSVPKGAPMRLVTDGDTSRTYEVAVTPADADSPYQSRSSWGFFFETSTNGDPSTGFADGDATLDVSVSR